MWLRWNEAGENYKYRHQMNPSWPSVQIGTVESSLGLEDVESAHASALHSTIALQVGQVLFSGSIVTPFLFGPSAAWMLTLHDPHTEPDLGE